MAQDRQRFDGLAQAHLVTQDGPLLDQRELRAERLITAERRAEQADVEVERPDPFDDLCWEKTLRHINVGTQPPDIHQQTVVENGSRHEIVPNPLGPTTRGEEPLLHSRDLGEERNRVWIAQQSGQPVVSCPRFCPAIWAGKKSASRPGFLQVGSLYVGIDGLNQHLDPGSHRLDILTRVASCASADRRPACVSGRLSTSKRTLVVLRTSSSTRCAALLTPSEVMDPTPGIERNRERLDARTSATVRKPADLIAPNLSASADTSFRVSTGICFSRSDTTVLTPLHRRIWRFVRQSGEHSANPGTWTREALPDRGSPAALQRAEAARPHRLSYDQSDPWVWSRFRRRASCTAPCY